MTMIPLCSGFRGNALLGSLLGLSLVLTGCGGGGGSDGPPSGGSQALIELPEDVPRNDLACGGSDAIMLDKNDLTASAKLAFITAQSGDVIVFPEGKYQIDDTLTLDGTLSGLALDGVTICGQGIDKTVLDFTDSVGDDALFMTNLSNVEIYGMAIIEAANNALKIQDADGVYIHDVATVWEGEPDSGNGAYGLYPVESANVLIEDSYVRGSADAGVYVGQSDRIVVRNNIAEWNVAGMEIENSTNADMYSNIARHNTGGLLVFDLPIGNGKYGSGVRVFDNTVVANNTQNFANHSSNPGGVHIVPPGTGVIVLSTNDVEIYNNTIDQHDTLAVVATSFLIAEPDLSSPSYGAVADGWSPLVRNIYIHDNTITNAGGNPNGTIIEPILAVFEGYGKAFPQILYDGLGEQMANSGLLNAMGEVPYTADDKICQESNGASVLAGFVYDPDEPTTLDGDGNPTPSPDSGPGLLNCTHSGLSPATVTFAGTDYGCGSDDNGDACQL